jgi:TldD protein
MSDHTRGVDDDFTALPLGALTDAALQRARDLGAEHADLRVERVRRSDLTLRDGRLSGSSDTTDAGLAVRVVVDGTWGFSATAELT